RSLLWVVLVLLVLDNLGVNISTLMAGLGIGGVAIALATQNILGDLFASLSIVLDKPFVVGDFIVVGDLMGTVERVGLKTTRLRSLSGEQLIFANADLLGSRVRNFKRMSERRVLFDLGVTYETQAATLSRIPAMLREIVDAERGVRFDRAHLRSFDASAVTFEVVYYILDPDYNRFMDTQQRINLAIFRRFEAENVEFAYPTQTLYVRTTEVAHSGPRLA
ncbi:MAG TPA: mechanosensitive ion channel family protein, partial [Gemmatimonadales bacterium]|nr:mechanosensitive ion channel family protein [Gemmatimonadales bacterium]